MPKKDKDKARQKPHDPTPEERDERFKAPEGMTFEEAVERVLGPVDDDEDDD